MDQLRTWLAPGLCLLLFLGACSDDDGDDGNDPQPGTWVELAPLAAGARQEMPAVELAGEIVTIGGFDSQGRAVATVEAYDPVTNRWRRLADVPATLHHANAAAVDGRLFVVGYLGDNFLASGRVFAYDRAGNSWTERAPMPAGTERGASGTAVAGGSIYVVGGLRGQSVRDASAYNPASNTWTVLPPMANARDHLCAGAIDGVVYAASGRAGALVSALEAFNPGTGSWSTLAPIPTARGGIACATFDGRLFVFGGEGNPAVATGVFDDTEAYNPDANQWEALSPMRTPRHGIGAATVNGRIYVPGGATRQGFGATATSDAFVPP